ncbi:hypothetical protein PVAR5_3542 [Paecilomyces variotii No. 5]|uniref:Uncharacterized protein n=1 Tax=Byssochlamys spectabilis (strain No. 5 / NBRC 109023) TaxID=1356009 RepID=V5FCV9_BYSSN|nr:hypothetical protein PVAR5_3542 [Paecilomyces variotii No. 5]
MNKSVLLLQKTNRWTTRHLEIARVRVTRDVSAVELFEDLCPEDGEPEFENIADRLCGPSREELEKCADTMDLPADDKAELFEDIYTILREDVKKNHLFFKSWLKKLITEIFNQILPESSRTYLYVDVHPRTTNLQIVVPQLSRGYMKVDGVITKDNAEEGYITVPLAILSYYGFTITLDRTFVQISKAVVDREYLESFWQEGSITTDMQLYRAKKLDLLDLDDR